jgi:hypothetical protein
VIRDWRVWAVGYAGVALGFALGTIGRWEWVWSTVFIWVPIALGLAAWAGLAFVYLVKMAWWEWRP